MHEQNESSLKNNELQRLQNLQVDADFFEVFERLNGNLAAVDGDREQLSQSLKPSFNKSPDLLLNAGFSSMAAHKIYTAITRLNIRQYGSVNILSSISKLISMGLVADQIMAIYFKHDILKIAAAVEPISKLKSHYPLDIIVPVLCLKNGFANLDQLVHNIEILRLRGFSKSQIFEFVCTENGSRNIQTVFLYAEKLKQSGYTIEDISYLGKVLKGGEFIRLVLRCENSQYKNQIMNHIKEHNSVEALLEYLQNNKLLANLGPTDGSFFSVNPSKPNASSKVEVQAATRKSARKRKANAFEETDIPDEKSKDMKASDKTGFFSESELARPAKRQRPDDGAKTTVFPKLDNPSASL